MHDLYYEGIYCYDMAFIIQYFIQNKYFSLSILNSQMKYFSYSNFEKNKPLSVTKKSFDKWLYYLFGIRNVMSSKVF